MLPSTAGDSKESYVGLVGDIVGIDSEIIDLLRSREFIPVVMPIGAGAEGEADSINSGVVAGKLAQTLRAEKLDTMMTDAGR